MSTRSTGSGTITFALIAIPVKLYTAQSPGGIKFNMLTKAGNRVKQRIFDAVTGEEVTHDTCDKGYEVAKDQFLRFTADEIKALEAKSDGTMDIREFVEASSIDALQVEKCYFLGPDKGGDKGYQLLADTLKGTGKVAIAQWAARGKEQLVAIREYNGGLMLQQLFYADEIREFESKVAKLEVSDVEREMAAMLVNTMTTGAFDARKYTDGWTKRVEAAIEQKKAGEAISAPATLPKHNVMDMLAALKASVEKVKSGK